MPTCLCTSNGWSPTATANFAHCDRQYSPQSLKYSLSFPLQKKKSLSTPGVERQDDRCYFNRGEVNVGFLEFGQTSYLRIGLEKASPQSRVGRKDMETSLIVTFLWANHGICQRAKQNVVLDCLSKVEHRIQNVTSLLPPIPTPVQTRTRTQQLTKIAALIYILCCI